MYPAAAPKPTTTDELKSSQIKATFQIDFIYVLCHCTISFATLFHVANVRRRCSLIDHLSLIFLWKIKTSLLGDADFYMAVGIIKSKLHVLCNKASADLAFFYSKIKRAYYIDP